METEMKQTYHTLLREYITKYPQYDIDVILWLLSKDFGRSMN